MNQSVVTYIDTRRQEILDFLETVVNIDSGAYTIEGVNQVAAHYTTRLTAMGFEVQSLPSAKYAPHLLARKYGSGQKRVLFLCHMDTVFEEGEASRRPFTVKDGKAFGPGVLDMKGGGVCALYGMEALLASGYEDFASITFLMNSDEERGSETSEAFIIEEGKHADAVLVPESGKLGGAIVVERQGGGIFNLHIYGKPSHAGNSPRDGIHSIDELARKTLAMHALTDYDNGRSISVGVVHGGTRSNIIPEHAFAEIDIRCKLDADGKFLMDAMQAITNRSYVPGTRSELKRVMYRPPIERTPKNLELFAKIKEAGAELGLNLTEGFSGGGSDGNYTSSLGTATIDALGPEGEFPHSETEYIVVESLYQRAKLIAFLIPKI